MRRAVFLLVLVFSLLFFCPFSRIAALEGADPESFAVKSRRETANAKRIDIQKAFDIFKSGKAILISVDQAEYYKSRRILGAINIPAEMIPGTKLSYPKEQEILLYCR